MHPMPPKDPPLERVGHLAAAPPSGTFTKRSWWQIVAWCVFGGVVALFLLAVVFMPTGHGDGWRTLRVTARLVASGTGVPVEGARVLPVSSYDLEHAWEPEEAWETTLHLNPSLAPGAASRQQREPAGADDRWDHEGTRSGPGGRVEMVVDLWTSVTAYRFWSTHSAQVPEDEVAALWIAPEGREPVIVRLEEGRFQQHEDGEDHPVWGTYDLGIVMVSVGGNAN